MITIEDGRKSRQENKSLKAKMCAKRTGIQPSICRSRSHLVGWHLQAPEMFVSSLETKCINWQPTAIAQIFRMPKKSTTLNLFQPCSTERFTVSKISEHENQCAKFAIPLDIFAPWGGMWGCVRRVSSTIPPLRLMPLALGPFLKLVASPSEVLGIW